MILPRLHLPGGQPFDLAYRLSTPSHRARAEIIDPAYPTILFCHPVGLDSFFYYPQYDDPRFYENFNLLGFDVPGHGSSTVHGIVEGEYTWAKHAHTLVAALHALKISSVHLMGTSMGCISAAHLAALAPNMIDSLILVAPLGDFEPADWTLAYSEVVTGMRRAYEEGDIEALDTLTTINFDYCTAGMNDPVVRELHDEYIQLSRARMQSGEARPDRIVPIFSGLLTSRRDCIPNKETAGLDCPKLVLQGKGSQEGWAPHDRLWENLVNEHNAVREKMGQPPNGVSIVLEGVPRWMTLVAPDLVNPLIVDFVSRKPSSTLSPSPPLTPYQSRRPSTPRDTTRFVVPPPPKAAPGRTTVGEMMDKLDSHGASAQEAGVKVEVEVLVEVDGGDSASGR